METPSTRAARPQIKPATLRIFHQRLRAWYQAHGRHDLPWRHTSDPYAIWISEVMLQQTQVSTVLARFYHPFLEKFPTVAALANAPREQVMKAWEGLGYYRRAGYLQEAAKQAQGQLPADEEGLRALPGIGKNTARAILSFAHHRPVAIMEANVKRIVARIFAWSAPNDNDLWEGAELLLDRVHPFDYNQSLMDLGSLICLPKHPACTICPAHGICEGKHAPVLYPAPKQKKPTPVREVAIDVAEDAQGRFYLEQRSEALLGGLYGFPQSPLGASSATEIGIVTHTYSHFKLIGHVFYRSSEKSREAGWYSRAQIAQLPLSAVDHKTLALVDKCHTEEKKSAKPRKAHAAD